MCSISSYLRCILAIVACVLIETSESFLPNQEGYQEVQLQGYENPKFKTWFRFRRNEIENCGPTDLEMVRTIMDRICMLCHELKSHHAPNTRVECRNGCFNNPVFQSCMKIFSGVHSKEVRTEPTAPVPLYTEQDQSLEGRKSE